MKLKDSMTWPQFLLWIDNNITSEFPLCAIGSGYGLSVGTPLRETYKAEQRVTNSGIVYYACKNRNKSNTKRAINNLQRALNSMNE